CAPRSPQRNSRSPSTALRKQVSRSENTSGWRAIIACTSVVPERGHPTTKIRRIAPPDCHAGYGWQHLVDGRSLRLHLTITMRVVTAPIAPLQSPGGGHRVDRRSFRQQVARFAAGQHQVEFRDDAVAVVLE